MEVLGLFSDRSFSCFYLVPKNNIWFGGGFWIAAELKLVDLRHTCGFVQSFREKYLFGGCCRDLRKGI